MIAPRMMHVLAALPLLVATPACSKKEPAGGAAPAAGTAAGTAAAPAAGTAAAPAAGTAAAAAVPMETDPTASDKVVATKLGDADLEGIDLPGERQHVIGWTDRHGTNAVVITRQPRPKNGGLLVATHLVREGDGSWTANADFKELIDECEHFDLSLYAQTGDWSVTDLDADGLGEATFAWSAGCRSDVSPLTHKVLIVEGGAKYVLRGKTIDQTGAGGEFEADTLFQKVPPSFLAHAEKVWKATVKEPS